MSPSGDGDQDGRKTSESSDRLRERLRELERKLGPGDDKRENLSDEEIGRRSSALGKAFKISTELVAGVFVGGFIGWALDKAFGTHFLIVIFLLLGIAAGFVNVIRAARGMGEK
jgi:ATP synthase protein I